ncbi:hypothetical protein DOZ80_17505 [Pseudomonas fluorescens]|uniref:Uncharacterized protein n=1 Tax=Pseudomonas fluorescens TaxID=294 RepID=A0A327N1L8_PSEFL|nr:hypothetical protein DOZ80_17505 [Pseudomonas fluorescens]
MFVCLCQCQKTLFVGASSLAKNPGPPRGIWFYALSLTTIASKLAPALCRSELARKKKLGAPLGIWFYALSFTTIASKLAPTGRLGMLRGGGRR